MVCPLVAVTRYHEPWAAPTQLGIALMTSAHSHVIMCIIFSLKNERIVRVYRMIFGQLELESNRTLELRRSFC